MIQNQKRPLNSPEIDNPEKKQNQNNSAIYTDITSPFASSFVSLCSGSPKFHSSRCVYFWKTFWKLLWFKIKIHSLSFESANSSFTMHHSMVSTTPKFIDLICTMVYEMNGAPYLSPSLNDDDAFSMLRQATY